jgi:hypothetical protein
MAGQGCKEIFEANIGIISVRSIRPASEEGLIKFDSLAFTPVVISGCDAFFERLTHPENYLCAPASRAVTPKCYFDAHRKAPEANSGLTL